VGDPFGLTLEQRTRSDLVQSWTDLLAKVERNRKMIEVLPPGAVVRMTGWGGPYPDRTREEVLEMMI